MRKLPFLRIGHLGLVVLTGCGEIVLGQSVTLSVGIGQGTPGGSVVVPISLVSSGGAHAAALQWSLGYSADVTGVSVVVGTAATKAAKSLACNGNTCLIYGINTTVISDGIVATVTLQISSNSSMPIQITGVVAATPKGDSIPAIGVSGTALPLLVAAFPNSSILRMQAALTADSVSPTSSGGRSQTFTFVFFRQPKR